MPLYLESLQKQLATLPTLHRVAFAAACCERLLPNYIAFSKLEGWGDAEVLRSALDHVWQSIMERRFDEALIREFISKVEANTPDTEAFDSAITSAALDAGTAIAETLECCLDGDPIRVAQVANFARDTVDMHIQERDDMDYSDPQFEEKIAQDSLMIKELRRQSEDLQFLKGLSTLEPQHIEHLRAVNGYSNIAVA